MGPSAAAVVGVLLGTCGIAAAQALEPAPLVGELSRGGYVLVMRHANSPSQPPTRQAANPDNPTFERQLDAAGRASAAALGNAIRRLGIPIGEVLTSPLYRARETVRFARLPNATVVEELAEPSGAMQGALEKRAAWLRARVAVAPRAGNTLVVTHLPLFNGAFPEWGASVAQGEMVVFKPDGRGGTVAVARVPISSWPGLRR